MTYSIDFRQKVLAHKAKKGLTFAQTSERFDIGIATLFRWKKRLTPTRSRNKPPTKIHDGKLMKDVESRPDDYQWERAERFGVTGAAIGKALKRLGISYKKKHCSIQRRTRRRVSTSKKSSQSMKRKEGRLFIWMKVVLLKICLEPTVIPKKGGAAMASIIGMQRAALTPLVLLSALLF